MPNYSQSNVASASTPMMTAMPQYSQSAAAAPTPSYSAAYTQPRPTFFAPQPTPSTRYAPLDAQQDPCICCRIL